MSRDLVVFAVAFVVMEPLTYAAHRWVMHGAGWVLHRSHHRRASQGLQANDAFPVIFAAATIAAMAAATRVHSLHVLLAVGGGVTAYGFAYAFVHDVYIHRRIGRRLPVWRPLERLKAAHELHHRFGGEPYGMLCPVVPRALRERAATGPATATR